MSNVTAEAQRIVETVTQCEQVIAATSAAPALRDRRINVVRVPHDQEFRQKWIRGDAPVGDVAKVVTPKIVIDALLEEEGIAGATSGDDCRNRPKVAKCSYCDGILLGPFRGKIPKKCAGCKQYRGHCADCNAPIYPKAGRCRSCASAEVFRRDPLAIVRMQCAAASRSEDEKRATASRISEAQSRKWRSGRKPVVASQEQRSEWSRKAWSTRRANANDVLDKPIDGLLRGLE